MEYLKGGELLDKIFREKFLSEREASNITYVIANTLSYLHSNMVSWRIIFKKNI